MLIQSYLRVPMPEVAQALSPAWRNWEAGDDGLRGEWATVSRETRQPGHQPAGNLQGAQSAGPTWTASSAAALRGDTIVAEFKQILDKYVESHYGKSAKREEQWWGRTEG